MDFEELRAGRRRLKEFCSHHQASVEAFESHGSFRLHTTQPPLPRRLKHLTSTATCIESLLDCPDAHADAEGRANWFAVQALGRPAKAWQSEESASIYCRCRALPLVINHTSELSPVLEGHLRHILAQLDSDNRFAIGEADVTRSREYWYPENAFHTFWLLEILARLARFGAAFHALSEGLQLSRRRDAMLRWAWQTLGCQAALHRANSSARDTDQLGWSLAIITRFERTAELASTFRFRDLLKEAVEAFFLTQDPSGTWPHFDPLFHYSKAGNAYCYVFETLTVLLTNALCPEAALFRSFLKPHVADLFKLLDYAEATRMVLDSSAGGAAIGWSSGHRTNERLAESWATAAVFQSMEALRRLVGTWTREDALRSLKHHSVVLTTKDAREKLLQRGDTWSDGDTVGSQLLTMFVNPVLIESAENRHDPDERPIAERQMRSAIFFGPPGTSKTTLARAVAGAIGWDYVELHASHFVAGGLPDIQRTADEIFARLMELDHCVILFDEIDELVREREAPRERDGEAEASTDAFGRFLTTSMLPKLAELWNQRRIIYFVATNHIGYFDRALVRSQRFDALILVPPPSYRAKLTALISILARLAPDVTVSFSVGKEAIEAELENTGKADSQGAGLRHEHLLAKFVLLRYDQLEELVHALLPGVKGGRLTVTEEVMRHALKGIHDERLTQYEVYHSFLQDRGRGVRDFGRDEVWCVTGPPHAKAEKAGLIRTVGNATWFVGTKDLITRLAGPSVTFPMPGAVSFQGAGLSRGGVTAKGSSEAGRGARSSRKRALRKAKRRLPTSKSRGSRHPR